MKYGNTTIGGMSFGSTRIGGAKYGNTLVFQPGGNLPYTPVEYIETDGVAYINTNITGTPNKSAEIKILPVIGDTIYLGSWGSSADGEAKKFVMFRFAMFSSDSSYRIGFGYYYSVLNTNCPSVTNSVLNGTPFVAKASLKSGTQIVSVKEQGASEFTSYSRSYTRAVSSSLKMFLLALNNNGSVSQVARDGTRLYYCKIYSDADYSTLVFDGIPCYYNGAYGLWDRITDSFFGNAAGSGAFTGPQI